MAKKLNSMPDFRANMPRQPHDVSQSTGFSTCPGMLSPVYYDMLHTGDSIHFSASQFTRMNPLNVASVGDIDVHLDYFFVPLTVLYTPSSSMFYQTDDLVSSVFADKSQWSSFKDFPTYDFGMFLGDNFTTTGTPIQSLPQPLFGSSDPLLNWRVFDCQGKSIFRIFDLLDMWPTSILYTIDNDSTPSSVPSYTPWFALAYQAIYQLYFRNDDRERKNYHYNIDDKFSVGNWYENSLSTSKSIFCMNYASRPKDYFNSVKVSPIGSSVSALDSTTLTSLFQNVNTWLDSRSVQVSTNVTSLAPNLDSATQTRSYNNYLTSQNIRHLFMVEKLLRVIGRSEKNYESQFLAHYGVKIPHDVMHNITHIGHDMVTFSPKGIVSQADTYDSVSDQGAALGQVGGEGFSMLTGKKHNFEAPFHGVFMVISHIIPRQRYVLGLNKLHQLLSVTDFWQPEFDRKGMQPLFSYEMDASQGMSNRLGWQFAYEQFKRKSDRVTHAFQPSPSTNFTVNIWSPWFVSNFPLHHIGYDGTMYGSLSSPAINATDLLVGPCDLNIQMQVFHDTRWPTLGTGETYSSKPWLLYQTDPFICDFNLNIKKVNMMSEYGEPEL